MQGRAQVKYLAVNNVCEILTSSDVLTVRNCTCFLILLDSE